MKKRIITIMIISIWLMLNAQQMMGPPAGVCNFSGKNGVSEIPFELILNHIILTAELEDGSKVKLVLDTGMPAHGAMLYETEKINKIGLKYSGQAMIGGPGGELKPANIVMGTSLTFPGVEFTGLDVIVLPHDENTSKRFQHHDGVVGYSFFSRFVIELDFEKKIMKVIEPEQFSYTGTGNEIGIEIESNVPSIFLTPIQKGVELEKVKAVLDLGATGAVSFDIGEGKSDLLPEKVLPWEAFGISGKIDISQGRLEAALIGDNKIKNLVASFNMNDFQSVPGSSSKGLLGMEILRRFDLIIDYQNSRIILEPNRYFSEPFETNMTGIKYFRNENKYLEIEGFVADSPASEEDLREGDLIEAINGINLKKISDNELKKLFSQENFIVELKIQRDGKNIEIKLKSRRLI